MVFLKDGTTTGPAAAGNTYPPSTHHVCVALAGADRALPDASAVCQVSEKCEERDFARYHAETPSLLAAAAAVLFFDYCLMLNLEVSHIWPSRWSLTKILYFLSRYSAFVDIPLTIYYLNPPDNLPLKVCTAVNIAIAVGNVFGVAIAEAILFLRTYALSGRSRWFLAIFGSLYVMSVGGGAVSVWLFLRSVDYLPPIPGFGGCLAVGTNFPLVAASVAASLAYETVLMAYTLHIWRKTYRHQNNALVSTLYGDGVTYYVLLFLGSATNLAMILTAPDEIRLLLNTPLRVLHSLLSTRVLLHLRETERQQQAEIKAGQKSGWANMSGATPSAIEFEHRTYTHAW
ncbi:hypothetical protein C8R46DRAFT_1191865 [Mycena filopes]|nr:hypothetical protein C8R46DRAFT_1191865 [Mycena filopes]